MGEYTVDGKIKQAVANEFSEKYEAELKNNNNTDAPREYHVLFCCVEYVQFM